MIPHQTSIGNVIQNAELQNDGNSINVYSLQKIFSEVIDGEDVYVFNASPFSHAVVRLDNFGLIMHEIGHAIGLHHTFTGKGLYPNTLAVNMVLSGLCKNPLAEFSGNVLCKINGDGLCDTGLDTWNLDINDLDGLID